MFLINLWTSTVYRLIKVPRLRMSGAIPLPPHICLNGLDRDNFSFHLYIPRDLTSIYDSEVAEVSQR